MNKNQCFVIFGAGSVGCYLGGILLSQGYNVIFIGRSSIKHDLEKHGLFLSNWQGLSVYIAPKKIRIELIPESLQEADCILVTVKNKDTQTAAEAIKKHATADAVVVSFQNGLHNANVLRDHLICQEVLAGMVPFNVLNQSKGHFHCGTEGLLALEKRNGIERHLVQAFEESGLPINLHTVMEEVLWGKLIMNLNNSLNALAGIPLLEELQQAAYRKVLAMSIKESLIVLKTAGIKAHHTGKIIPALAPFVLCLPNFLFTRVAQSMLKIDPEARSSMWEDLQKNRVTEIDYLNGEILQLGKKFGIPTPVNKKIVELIKQAECLKKGSPKITSETLLQQVCSNSDI